MKEFEIWIEGFYAQGMFVEPRCIAKGVEAETFREACYEHFNSNSSLKFDNERLTCWGHSLFPKEGYDS